MFDTPKSDITCYQLSSVSQGTYISSALYTFGSIGPIKTYLLPLFRIILVSVKPESSFN